MFFIVQSREKVYNKYQITRTVMTDKFVSGIECMREWKYRLVRMFWCAGMENEEYLGIQDEIYRTNREMLSLCTRAAMLIFGLLYLMSCAIKSLSGNQLLYLSVFFALALLEGLRRSLFGRFPRLVIVGCYSLLLILYGYSMAIGVIQNAYPSTTFCVLLFAGSFLFVDRPYRMNLFMLMMSILFCILSYCFKTAAVFRLDLLNAVSFFLLGLVCSHHLLYTKVTGLAHSRKMMDERDTDGLTGLLVKTASERNIRQYIRLTKDAGALIIIDLDNFKKVNDTLGHAYGDRILKLTGSCIEAAFGRNDIKGRFGGDEFVIFVRGRGSRKEVEEKLEHFRFLMKEGFKEECGLQRVSQSIGAAFYPEDAGDYHTLFEKADEALYEAKRRGKDCYCFYTSVKIHRQS